METWSFIGSDKNAGKTTALNFVHRRLHERGAQGPLCLTSIGINGEPVDNYENRPKPQFAVYGGDYVVSALEHFAGHGEDYAAVQRFDPPAFSKPYLLAKALRDFDMVVEGPNDKRQLLLLKEGLHRHLPAGRLLVDGSIDRQFIAHPQISDGIFFSLLISDRQEQRRKARDFLLALQLPACTEGLRRQIEQALDESTRSLLLDAKHGELYRGRVVPFLDQGLKGAINGKDGGDAVLYLNGALTLSLFDFLADVGGLQVVLDNFTLYHNVSVHEGLRRGFGPELSLLHPVAVRHIFIRREGGETLPLPPDLPVTDLFRDNVKALVF